MEWIFESRVRCDTAFMSVNNINVSSMLNTALYTIEGLDLDAFKTLVPQMTQIILGCTPFPLMWRTCVGFAFLWSLSPAFI
jgi:hypothetical protein